MTWQRQAEKELARPTHQNKLFCELCFEKLKDVHPELVSFVAYTRSRNKSVHVSCGFRDQKAQDEAFATGKSMLNWPDSKHNKTPAQAVDLFTIDEDGVARFVRYQMEMVWTAAKSYFRIAWAGNWEGKFKESVHFELRD